uniref:Uncharacterized protein LOC100176584 n=1 Tax=Phallusia mammillata TaxID=59560 RepID=A0A6F9DH81_9ASCI|nr:uncharacterized protein LOC100176584 [Phallusia mammillata]
MVRVWCETRSMCRLIVWLLVLLCSFFAQASIVETSLDNTTAETLENNDVDRPNTIQALPCGGTVEAGYLATALEIPKLQPGQSASCGWWIRSPHPTMTIGVAVVDTLLKWFATDTLSIDIYDGMPSNRTLLTHWHGLSDLQHFMVPVVSTTNTIFVNYTATGPMVNLDCKLMYYMCGGLILESRYFIQSPVFNASTPHETVGHLSCKWRIEMPSSAKYGYVIVDYLNLPKPSHCDTLLLTTTNGTIKSVEDGGNCTENSDAGCAETNTTSQLNEFHLTRRRMCSEIEKFSPTVTSTNPNMTSLNPNVTSSHREFMTSHTSMLSINSERFQFIVFNGSVTTLQYSTLVPEYHNGFQFFYEIMRKPYTGRRKTKSTPWYLTYAPLVFYVPIGITLGLSIIMFQNIRHPRDLKIKTFPDAGNYSTATSLVESVVERSTPKSAIRSIMKRSKSLDANRLSDCSYMAVPGAAASGDKIHWENKTELARDLSSISRETSEETVDKPLVRKVTFKKPSIV